VFGLDPELLDFLPKPTVAMVLLYPTTVKRRDTENVTAVKPDDEPGVFFMSQTIFNACGMIALIHAVVNSPIKITKDRLCER
jgi:ubiquitin carboxyl-terminal hydrolase L3